ncbi:MAG: protein phosphatase 2C domain-containing protein [Burkholderiaceae bacterium]
MRFSVYQESRKGGRRVNQDRMGYLYTRESALLMVADGMGGHARGEVAAEIMVQTLAALFQREARPLIVDPARFLKDAVLVAHHELHRFRAERSLPEAPRTTLVAAIVQQGQVIWAHVGDSRIYLIRGGEIVARTVDHSRVQHLVMAGLIRPDEAKNHPERNRIFNCVGADVPPNVEVARPQRLAGGDTLLLCSDGVWGALDEGHIAQSFGPRGVMRAVPDLLDRALLAAGADADNCTAVALTWSGDESLDMVPPSDEPVSTLLLPEGAMASTIQVGRPSENLPDEELTDDQIDDAVAEIQRAIQRAGRLVNK